jgi:hypothetical protein
MNILFVYCLPAISRECVIARLICKQLVVPQTSSITAGLIPTPLRRMSDSRTSRIRHSRMFLSGIQAAPKLDPRLRHSGVTALGQILMLGSDTR